LFISGIFGLAGRAEIADRIVHILFLVADQAIIVPPTLFNRKTTRERHTYGMSRFIKDEHSKRGYQVIEQAVLRIPEVRVTFAGVIPQKTSLRNHYAEFTKCLGVSERSIHPVECLGAMHSKELVVFAKDLLPEVGAN
jgi:hypothetical protein